MSKNTLTYKEGLIAGIPIALAYLFASTGFGITAVSYGIPVLNTILISMTNLTSAGQVAGIEIIRDCSILLSSVIEMILAQVIISIRYSLMGITLSQKLDDSFTTKKRLICSFVITDEIFAVCAGKHGDINTRFMLGVATLPFFGWTLGTTIGAVAASLIPTSLVGILSLSIYGMFLSIFIPGLKRGIGSKISIILAISISIALYYIPCFSFISSGFRIMISAILSSVIASIIEPKDLESEENI